MITMYQGNSGNAETFRLILACNQCQAHVEIDVPLNNIRDQGDAATDPYIERARIELAKTCPHIQEELDRHAKDALPSQQGAWNTLQRLPSSYTDKP